MVLPGGRGRTQNGKPQQIFFFHALLSSLLAFVSTPLDAASLKDTSVGERLLLGTDWFCYKTLAFIKINLQS